MRDIFGYDSVQYKESTKSMIILDQTLLPQKESFITINEEGSLKNAIKTLKVRGAPAIGIAAAIGIAVILKRFPAKTNTGLIDEFTRLAKELISLRPTAVNLKNSIDRLKGVLIDHSFGYSVKELKSLLISEALKIKEEDIEANIKMANFALTLLKDGDTILTYCNAGHLAVSRYGTALSPVYLAKEKGVNIKVYVCETRPLLQGARLTAYELKKAGIDFTLICDNMVAHLMSMGKIDAVITGCDRIAANGDTANKIGTHTVSVCASHYNIPHYIIGPSTTIDVKCPNGSKIIIEEREGAEITEMWYKKRMAPPEIKVFNPAFDITPGKLISAIITEAGIHKFPYKF